MSRPSKQANALDLILTDFFAALKKRRIIMIIKHEMWNKTWAICFNKIICWRMNIIYLMQECSEERTRITLNMFVNPFWSRFEEKKKCYILSLAPLLPEDKHLVRTSFAYIPMFMIFLYQAEVKIFLKIVMSVCLNNC